MSESRMAFFSDDRQDEFVANLLKFKRDGYYLDIGSCASIGSNNTYVFESLGWKGICIEKNPHFNDSYKTRTCRYLNEDALEVDYEKIFKEENFPHLIDYLSLDIDEQSAMALKVLPLDKYRFKVITVEHDGHYYGDLYKKPQREILKSKGYFLLGEDVLNISGRNIGQEHAWEDWFIFPEYFNMSEINEISCKNKYTEEIINRIKKAYEKQ